MDIGVSYSLKIYLVCVCFVFSSLPSTYMPRQIVDSDEEPQAQEIDGHNDSNSTSRRHTQKPSTKQKEIGTLIYMLCSSSLH